MRLQLKRGYIPILSAGVIFAGLVYYKLRKRGKATESMQGQEFKMRRFL